MELYRKGFVEIEDIEKDMLVIKEQRKAITENIQEQQSVENSGLC